MLRIEIVRKDGAFVMTSAGGERLVDICDRFEAPIPFACRSATCGTCCVHVEHGNSLLDEPDHDEARLLAKHHAVAGIRLACAAAVKRASGLIRLRVCESLDE